MIEPTPKENQTIQHLLRCMMKFADSSLHHQMVEEDTKKECEMLGITDRKMQFERFKTNLFESQRQLNVGILNFYSMLDELKGLSLDLTSEPN